MKAFDFQTMGEAYMSLSETYNRFFYYRDNGDWDKAFFSKQDWEELARILLSHKNLSIKGYRLIRTQYRSFQRGWK